MHWSFEQVAVREFRLDSDYQSSRAYRSRLKNDIMSAEKLYVDHKTYSSKAEKSKCLSEIRQEGSGQKALPRLELLWGLCLEAGPAFHRPSPKWVVFVLSEECLTLFDSHCLIRHSISEISAGKDVEAETPLSLSKSEEEESGTNSLLESFQNLKPKELVSHSYSQMKVASLKSARNEFPSVLSLLHRKPTSYRSLIFSIKNILESDRHAPRQTFHYRIPLLCQWEGESSETMKHLRDPKINSRNYRKPKQTRRYRERCVKQNIYRQQVKIVWVQLRKRNSRAPLVNLSAFSYVFPVYGTSRFVTALAELKLESNFKVRQVKVNLSTIVKRNSGFYFKVIAKMTLSRN